MKLHDFIPQSRAFKTLAVVAALLFGAFGSPSLVAAANIRKEILLVAPPDKLHGPLNDQFFKELVAFVESKYDFDMGQIFPLTPEGHLVRISTLEDFEKGLEETLAPFDRTQDAAELSILFFAHGGLDQQNSKLFLWLGPLKNETVYFTTFLNKIRSAIARHKLEKRISLNIAVGSCHSGQCVTDYENDPIRDAPYRKALFGFIDAQQTIYGHSFLELWSGAERIERYLQSLDFDAMPGKNQFERWARILSLMPLWVTGDSWGYFMQTAAAGTNLDAAIVSDTELLALGMALPLLEWGYKSYSPLIAEIKNRLAGPTMPKRYDQIILGQFKSQVGAQLLHQLVQNNRSEFISTLVQAANRKDAAQFLSARFISRTLRHDLEEVRSGTLDLSDQRIIELRAQMENFDTHLSSDSSEQLMAFAKKVNVTSPILLRHTVLYSEWKTFKKLVDEFEQAKNIQALVEMADLSLQHIVDYAKNGENYRTSPMRWVMVKFLMSKHPALRRWVNRAVSVIVMQPKILSTTLRELKEYRKYWDDPDFQIASETLIKKLEQPQRPAHQCEGVLSTPSQSDDSE